MTSEIHWNDLADDGAPGSRRLKCYLGPLAGARLALAAGALERLVPLPSEPGVPPRVAVYRVQRRRRARGAAFEVLVYAGNRRLDAAPAHPLRDFLPHGAEVDVRGGESASA